MFIYHETNSHYISQLFKIELSGTFPDDWKKDNVVQVHKKDNKQSVDNCGPVSLLPTCTKVSEKLVFDAIFEFMIESNLLRSTHSGFKTNYSCINQIISIIHCFFVHFYTNPSLEVRGLFLDLSKTSDKFGRKMFCIN